MNSFAWMRKFTVLHVQKVPLVSLPSSRRKKSISIDFFQGEKPTKSCIKCIHGGIMAKANKNIIYYLFCVIFEAVACSSKRRHNNNKMPMTKGEWEKRAHISTTNKGNKIYEIRPMQKAVVKSHPFFHGVFFALYTSILFTVVALAALLNDRIMIMSCLFPLYFLVTHLPACHN